jgi:hypothetical protein
MALFKHPYIYSSSFDKIIGRFSELLSFPFKSRVSSAGLIPAYDMRSSLFTHINMKGGLQPG